MLVRVTWTAKSDTWQRRRELEVSGSVGIPTAEAQQAPAPEKAPPLLPTCNLIFRKDPFEILTKPHSRIPLSVSSCFPQEVWLITKLRWEEPVAGSQPGSDDTTLLQSQPALPLAGCSASTSPLTLAPSSSGCPTIKLLTVPCYWLYLSPLLLPPASPPTHLLPKKEFIGLGLHLRPVHADHAWPPFQWTLNSVLSVYGNNNRRIRPPPDRGTLKIIFRLLLA